MPPSGPGPTRLQVVSVQTPLASNEIGEDGLGAVSQG